MNNFTKFFILCIVTIISAQAEIIRITSITKKNLPVIIGFHDIHRDNATISELQATTLLSALAEQNIVPQYISETAAPDDHASFTKCVECIRQLCSINPMAECPDYLAFLARVDDSTRANIFPHLSNLGPHVYDKIRSNFRQLIPQCFQANVLSRDKAGNLLPTTPPQCAKQPSLLSLYTKISHALTDIYQKAMESARKCIHPDNFAWLHQEAEYFKAREKAFTALFPSVGLSQAAITMQEIRLIRQFLDKTVNTFPFLESITIEALHKILTAPDQPTVLILGTEHILRIQQMLELEGYTTSYDTLSMLTDGSLVEIPLSLFEPNCWDTLNDAEEKKLSADEMLTESIRLEEKSTTRWSSYFAKKDKGAAHCLRNQYYVETAIALNPEFIKDTITRVANTWPSKTDESKEFAPDEL